MVPFRSWIANVLRTATMLGGPLVDRRHVILDNDGKYGAQTIAVLGKRLVWTCIEAPDMNAFIERWMSCLRVQRNRRSRFCGEVCQAVFSSLSSNRFFASRAQPCQRGSLVLTLPV